MKDLTLEEAGEVIKEKLQNKYILALAVIVSFSAFIRFQYAFFEGMWVDESIHGMLAKELPQHLLEYSLPQKGGPMIKRPPVYNYLIAFSNMLFGDILSTDNAIRLVSPVMGTLGVISTYLLGREVKGREVGLAAATLVSVNGMFWFLSERILMGATLTTLFTTSILVFYYGLEDKKYSKYAIWSWGPLIALTALTKQPGYFLGPIIVVYFLYKKRDALKDYFMTDKDLKNSELYDVLTDRNYYIALGLFALVMLPWVIRNILVCNFPLCSFKLALETAVSDTGRQIDVQGALYFLKALPGLILVPLFAVLIGKIFRDGVHSFSENQDLTVKKIALTLGLTTTAYIANIELLPLVLVSSIAMFARTDGEKLLWLSAGIGIGIMSINATKVSRYIIFVIPSLVTIASIGLWEFSSWISQALPENRGLDKITPGLILLLLVLPLFTLSFTQGQQMTSRNSFSQLEPAGEWMDRNTKEDARIAATSPQVRYFAHPRMPVASANRLPNNETAFIQFLRDENISYVMADVYERTQPDWMNTGMPPYRLSSSTVSQIRSGQISGNQVVSQYKTTPNYLIPLQSFGNTNIPLTEQNQPEVIIYQVNQSAL